MAKVRKVSLQTYVHPIKKDAYLIICEKRGVSASGEIADFIGREIKKHTRKLK